MFNAFFISSEELKCHLIIRLLGFSSDFSLLLSFFKIQNLPQTRTNFSLKEWLWFDISMLGIYGSF
jgi:hypothetical protein